MWKLEMLWADNGFVIDRAAGSMYGRLLDSGQFVRSCWQYELFKQSVAAVRTKELTIIDIVASNSQYAVMQECLCRGV